MRVPQVVRVSRIGGRRRKTAGALLLSALLAGSLLTGCEGAEQRANSRLNAIALQDLLVTEQELPQGFFSSPIVGQELARATEGTQQPSRSDCVEPSKAWLADVPADQRAGAYLEYPDAHVVVALLLVRPAGSLPRIDAYRKECQSFTRTGSGLSLSIKVRPYTVPEKATVAAAGGVETAGARGTERQQHSTGHSESADYWEGARGYQERITVRAASAPVSSTYLFASIRGVGVVAILRSRTPSPTPQQTASLDAIFAGQIEKIARSAT